MHRIKKTGGTWEKRANLPYGIWQHCTCADYGQDRIYQLGGYRQGSSKRREVYYYTQSSNSWTSHSLLPWTAQESVSCNIVTQKDGARWLLAVNGNYYGYIVYWELSLNTGWHHVSTLWNNYKQRAMAMVSLSPTTTLMLGSWSQRNSHSTRNVWRYNYDTKVFTETIHYLQNEHGWGDFTKARKSFRALANCQAERTYAVVGWGGHKTSSTDYGYDWEILLRKRRTVSDPQKPVRCDQAIPYLYPGRMAPGRKIATVRSYSTCYRSDGYRVQADDVWRLQLWKDDC